MKRAAITIAVIAVLGVVAAVLFSRFKKDLAIVKEQRQAVPMRKVPGKWRYDRLTPGHAVHVINHDLSCDDCHDPYNPDFSEVDTGMCTACHEEQASLAHVDSDGMPMDCYTCHIFRAEENVFGRWHCTRCHGPFETEANEGLSMHTTVPCETCHNPHEPTEETALPCNDCHRAMKVQHGRPRVSGTCVDCHGGHKLASEATACLECHQTEKPIVPRTATFAGHDSCSSCHEAHAFSTSAALRCVSCHERTIILAQTKTVEHRDCQSCHQPHAVRRAGDRACERCHHEVSSTHPVVENKRNCTSCHDPHPRRVAQTVFDCSHCHEEARSERAFHARETVCTDCHQPHAFDLSELGERALCVRCHAEQIRLTSRISEHSSCGNCHEGAAHELSDPVACASCHEEQLAQSPEGHRECASCHEPHRGTVSAETTCTTCHALAELPGLHRIPDDPQSEGHTDCVACHSVHIPRARADRETCMACHDNIADHEPDAKRCTGCHTFIRAKPRQR